MLENEKMYELFTDLLMEYSSVSIDSLTTPNSPFGEIDHKPSYQRYFVWDNTKCTSYIESIIMRTQIPPKIFWYTDNNELLDGRQRYETILKFINDDLVLNENGLYVLKDLKGKKFSDLDSKLQADFINTTIRILTITMNTPAKWDDYKIDQIKKAIFRRYNMGITPLKEVEIARAKYLDNDVTQYFIKKFKENKENFHKTSIVLSNKKNKIFYDMVEIIMAKIRPLLVIDKVKIDYFLTGKGKSYTLKLFDKLEKSKENNKKIYDNFIEKINILNIIKLYFDLHNFPHYIPLYETLFWALSILEKENIPIKKCTNEKFCSALIQFVDENKSPMLVYDSTQISVYMANKIRYHSIAKFFEKYFKIDFQKYIQVTKEFKEEVIAFEKEQSEKNITKNIIKHHQEYIEPKNMLIYELKRYAENKKLLLRPPYQRSESSDLTKASSIIESLLMRFKLLPIFIFVRKDGIKEVIDGQQRLLAILGFMGVKYKNEEGILTESCKHKFKLQGLEIMKELNGKEYKSNNSEKCLSEKQRKMLDMTNIPVVEIHENKYKNFKPVDLFIRLNNKPYPIKNHTFEIWNTILPNELLENIKTNTKKHAKWFYIKNQKTNIRMQNEELYTILVYLAANKSKHNIKFYQTKNRIIARTTQMANVSKFLYKIARKNQYKNLTEDVELFIEKLRNLLSNNPNCTDEYLEKELNKLITKSRKKIHRSKTILIILWNFLSEIEISVIKENNKSIKTDVQNLLSCFGYNATTTLENFEKELHTFNEKYKLIVKKEVIKPVKKAKKVVSTSKKSPIIVKDKESTVVNVSINVQGNMQK